MASEAYKWPMSMDMEKILKKQTPSGFPDAYGHSKLANVLFTKEFAARFRDTGITSYAVHPGTIITEIGWTLPFLKKHPTVFRILQPIVGFFLKDLEHGAQTVLCCAIAKELESESGKYYKECRAAILQTQVANDDVIASRW